MTSPIRVITSCLMPLTIRPETPTDFPTIAQVVEAAFTQPAEARLIQRLRSSPAYMPALALVAQQQGQVVGHIMMTCICIHGRGGDVPALALAPLAVAPPFQRQGIGSALVRRALEESRGLAHQRVIVLGHPEYYARFGFARASRWGIYPPFDCPDAAFMAMELVPGALDGCEGIVQYPPEFDEL